MRIEKNTKEKLEKTTLLRVISNSNRQTAKVKVNSTIALEECIGGKVIISLT